ncbi:Hypothetical predicted protein [Marmota monax]|uniref:Uncharacterized protein n=1 Tax=Marmota monax TaxID=9995 RepID=A0A5E4CJJ3_MARMO|nr:hypothetical protein GHT09_015581 [Marmota monax]VTJ81141.1 Hypothetical predicted protein [Marmota monax]
MATATLKDAPGQLGPSGRQKPRSGEPATPSILADGSGQRRPGHPLVALPTMAPRTRTLKSGAIPSAEPESSRGCSGTSFPVPRGLVLNGSQVPPAVPTKWRTSSPPAAAMTGALKPGLDRVELCVSPKGGGPGEGRFVPRSRSQNRVRLIPAVFAIQGR